MSLVVDEPAERALAVLTRVNARPIRQRLPRATHPPLTAGRWRHVRLHYLGDPMIFTTRNLSCYCTCCQAKLRIALLHRGGGSGQGLRGAGHWSAPLILSAHGAGFGTSCHQHAPPFCSPHVGSCICVIAHPTKDGQWKICSYRYKHTACCGHLDVKRLLTR